MSTSLRTAVVTGASSGIGAVYADRLAARGYALVLVARRAERLTALADRLTKTYGVKVDTLVADLEKDADVAKVETLLTEDSSIRLLINNAGIGRLGPFTQSAVGDSLAQIALNTSALTRLTYAALPGFLARNEGAIVNIASVLALHSLPISAVYSGTKAFVLAFSRGLQDELGETNVKVQVVMPAATATEIWDSAGVPLSHLDPQTVMTTENLVDAALAGFDRGESVTLPSLADETLWKTYDSARTTLFAATQTGTPAPRYQKA
jgi:uncharacterized protein